MIFTWDNADFLWNDNPYTWDEVILVQQLAAGVDEWNYWGKEDKDNPSTLTPSLLTNPSGLIIDTFINL